MLLPKFVYKLCSPSSLNMEREIEIEIKIETDRHTHTQNLFFSGELSKVFRHGNKVINSISLYGWVGWSCQGQRDRQCKKV